MQTPPEGAIGRETFINDHLIEDLSVEVIDSETGKFYFAKQHMYIPSVVVVKAMVPNAPHINFYMKGVTNMGNWATGSISLRAGVTGGDLNTDNFVLIDKDNKSKNFTFDETSSGFENGNIGTSPFNGGSAADVEGIANRILEAVNDIDGLSITAIESVPNPLEPGGAIITLVQDITGSGGNTIIDVAGVTGVDSENFTSGNNYGSGSFAASETFSGDLLIRAASLQIEYL